MLTTIPHLKMLTLTYCIDSCIHITSGSLLHFDLFDPADLVHIWIWMKEGGVYWILSAPLSWPITAWAPLRSFPQSLKLKEIADRRMNNNIQKLKQGQRNHYRKGGKLKRGLSISLRQVGWRNFNPFHYMLVFMLLKYNLYNTWYLLYLEYSSKAINVADPDIVLFGVPIVQWTRFFLVRRSIHNWLHSDHQWVLVMDWSYVIYYHTGM